MLKAIQVVGIVGFFICLSMMYMTNLGVRGIREHAPSFQSPDMRFHYSVEQLIQTFEEIGELGRSIYKKYLVLDCVFIFCFAVVMLTTTDLLFPNALIRNALYVLCIGRAVLDALENCFLLFVLKDYPMVNTASVTICSYFTTFKFVLLYIWIAAVSAQAVRFGIYKIKGPL